MCQNEKHLVHFTAESRVQSKTSSYGILDELVLGHVILRVFRYSLVNIIPPVVHTVILFVIDNAQF